MTFWRESQSKSVATHRVEGNNGSAPDTFCDSARADGDRGLPVTLAALNSTAKKRRFFRALGSAYRGSVGSY